MGVDANHQIPQLIYSSGIPQNRDAPFDVARRNKARQTSGPIFYTRGGLSGFVSYDDEALALPCP